MRIFAFTLAVALAAGALPIPRLTAQPALAGIPTNSANNAVQPTPRPCDEAAQLDGNGQPVNPSGATQITGSDTFTDDRGSVASLYPDRDTKTDAMYPLPCDDASIGGSAPPPEPTPSPDEAAAATALSTFDANQATQLIPLIQLKPPHLAPQKGIKCKIFVQPVPCDSSLFLRSGQPFEGRDIIYIHGLQLDQIKARIQNDPQAMQTWPANQAAFLQPGGYYRADAESYWRDHIREHVFDPDNPANPNAGWQYTSSDLSPVYKPKGNRFLVVAWSSNQGLEYAQRAVLTQIDHAMRTNENVHTPPTYPSTWSRPFCSNGCIIITHSAGSLVASTTMARAALGHFGLGGTQIAQHMRIHVSFAGAISGSPLATAGVAIALGTSVPLALCQLFGNLVNVPQVCMMDTSFVAHSILRDLVPYVAQTYWGPFVNQTPVPTLTVAGGHPYADEYGVQKVILPGLDDGVVSMNSACGNPNAAGNGPPPSGLMVSGLIKAYEMSENGPTLQRSAKLFLSQRNVGPFAPGPLYFAAGCTPYLSTTGMVMPVAAAFANTPLDARRRYNNHYSFIQGVINHENDGPGATGNAWPSAGNNPAYWSRVYWPYAVSEVEETSAVTDPNIYQQFADATYLVHPTFANMHEFVRGRSYQYKLFGKTHRMWIWKRTYHLLDKWQTKQSSHYVYEFVGRR